MYEPSKTDEVVVVVDLDGTICDHGHRVHHAQNREWERFHGELHKDRIHDDVVNLLRALDGRSYLLGLTGRNEAFREMTLDWMVENRVPIDDLLMRPDTDFTPDHILKPRLLAEHFGSWKKAIETIDFCLDDRDKVVEAFRSNGLPCWQVRPGSY